MSWPATHPELAKTAAIKTKSCMHLSNARHPHRENKHLIRKPLEALYNSDSLCTIPFSTLSVYISYLLHVMLPQSVN